MTANSDLSQLRVLVVEDEPMISFMIEDMLKEIGVREVAIAASVPNALSLLDQSRPDVAILDVNVAGRPINPVAERLAGAGVPFAFASGYGRNGVPEAWREHAVIQKPFDLSELEEGLRACLAQADQWLPGPDSNQRPSG